MKKIVNVVLRLFKKEDDPVALDNGVIPKNLKVLILDDNPDVLEVLGMHMAQLDHKNFVTCTSVNEAKKMLKTMEFDVLLLDWDLDDGTCMDIIRQTRSSTSKRLKEALTIVITGRNDVEDIMTLVQMNVKDHIIKPFDYAEFQDKIVYALERHHKQKHG